MKPGIGIDCGISLTKMAVFRSAETGAPALEVDYRTGTTREILQSLQEVERARAGVAARIALTGARARAFIRGLEDRESTRGTHAIHRIGEFEAWAAGARSLLRDQGVPDGDPFLLVSLGTGTSLLKVAGDAVERVGGSALGGGCVVGLASALVGTRDFKTLCELAARGERRRVDLRLGDVYPEGDIDLPAGAVAAHFGKLALENEGEPREGDEYSADLICALFALVADNIGLLVASHAERLSLRRCVVAGSTLENNPSLEDPLRTMLVAHGLEVVTLRKGAYAGARGALLLAP